MKLSDFAILVLIFIASLIPRNALIHSDFGQHHESVNAHLLMTYEAQNQQGKPAFLPLYSYNNHSDRGIDVLGGVHDEKNNYYYVSYPPGVFVFSRFYLGLYGQHDYMALRYLSLSIQFITALLFFAFLRKVFRDPRYTALLHLGTALFIFSVGNLWLYSYFFFADTLVLPLLLGASCCLMVLLGQQKSRWTWWSAYALLVFMACFTEWLSVFYCLGAAVLILLNRNISATKKRSLLLLSFGCLILALWITYLLYSSIAGNDALLQALKNKLAIRSGFANTNEMWFRSNFMSLNSYRFYLNLFLKNYLVLFQLTLVLCLTFLILRFYQRKHQTQASAGSFKPVFFLLILPGLLHFFVFTNFSLIHEFSQIKMSLVLCACLVAAAVYIQHFLRLKPVLLNSTCVVFIVGFALLNSYKLNPLVQQKPQHSNDIRLLTRAIAQHCKKDDLILVKMHFFPETCSLVQRLYIPVNDRRAAENMCLTHHPAHAVYLYPDSTGQAIRADRIK